MIKETIRREQLKKLVPLSDSTIYAMERRGDFPRRFAISPRCVVWDLAEVQAWLQSRKDEGRPASHKPDMSKRKYRPLR